MKWKPLLRLFILLIDILLVIFIMNMTLNIIILYICWMLKLMIRIILLRFYSLVILIIIGLFIFKVTKLVKVRLLLLIFIVFSWPTSWMRLIILMFIWIIISLSERCFILFLLTLSIINPFFIIIRIILPTSSVALSWHLIWMKFL